MQTVFVPVDGIVFHRSRDCSAIRVRRIDAIASSSPRARLFDPCPRCLPGAARRHLPAVSLDAVAELEPSHLESMRTEAARRRVTLLDWLSRHERQSEMVTS